MHGVDKERDAIENPVENADEGENADTGENRGENRIGDEVEDAVDRHIARWRDKAPFDERVEGIVSRIQLLTKHIRAAKGPCLAEVGLQEFEFETLHRLASRGRPWQATPSELAAELMMSPAGITGRLDTLEKSGLVQRIRGVEDRRRVDVGLTEVGHSRWVAAMNLISVEEIGIVGSLAETDQDTLIVLLKRMLVHVERGGG
ncbi:MarR family winged helix-turn-helix transcriptional regulator [Embleya sp. NBC_00896]|uniref:MarR family winged helix-turn-helix transcriptional regulator n=1 Tax=Embleya sp. NBC_00896 TaxID=2975961 RepID=UPI00386D4110|nr:MarR family transcriptional regulator [Embleya sp. NBC_00896]